MVMRRRPLLRGAMVGGAGYMAGKSAARNKQREGEQEARLAQLEQQQQPAPPPPAAPPAPAPAAGGTDIVSKLKELADLKAAGALNDAEFEAAKQKLLQG